MLEEERLRREKVDLDDRYLKEIHDRQSDYERIVLYFKLDLGLQGDSLKKLQDFW